MRPALLIKEIIMVFLNFIAAVFGFFTIDAFFGLVFWSFVGLSLFLTVYHFFARNDLYMGDLK